MTAVEIRPFRPGDLPGILRLCEAEGWPSFPADPARAARILTAPGVTTVVAAEARAAKTAQARAAETAQARAAETAQAHAAKAGVGAPRIDASGAGAAAAIVGFAELFSDGELQAYLANLAVAATHRRTGLGRRLVTEALRRAGGERVDLLSEDAAAAFYRSFPHFEKPGFRLYPFHEG
ncbi:GNAT family N-acetyltransferase [Actinoplanes sp. CA-030573]|uniref:GNAT family N-acetyltransferase n=1 Tax=Actinoplanes sp. CA-030573 TaxID=3239898 RepID=UPI003D8B91FC